MNNGPIAAGGQPLRDDLPTAPGGASGTPSPPGQVTIPFEILLAARTGEGPPVSIKPSGQGGGGGSMTIDKGGVTLRGGAAAPSFGAGGGAVQRPWPENPVQKRVLGNIREACEEQVKSGENHGHTTEEHDRPCETLARTQFAKYILSILDGEPHGIDDLTRGRCESAIIVSGQHFRCELSRYHDGWPHSNALAETIWGEVQS